MTVEQGVFGVAEAPAEAPAPPHRWTDVTPHPWRRYFARLLDLWVSGIAAILLLAFVAYLLAPAAYAQASETSDGASDATSSRILFLAAALLFAIPLNSLTIGLAGGSVGKWVFGVKVLRADGRPIGVGSAFVRELKVLLLGYGLAIPIVNIGTLVWSLMYLADKGHTQWDKPGRIVVVHRPWGRLQWAIAMAVVGLFLALAVLGALSEAMRS